MIDLSLDIFNKVKELVPGIVVTISKKGNVLIPYHKSTHEQRQIIWDYFEKEDTPYFVSDDAGIANDSLGIIVDKNSELKY